jgi:hypothetical protein
MAPVLRTLVLAKEFGGEARIKTQPDKLMLDGQGLCDGRESGDGVTRDYLRVRPWSFTGGAIKRVVGDVGSDPGIDLERGAHAVLMRE